MDNQTIFNRIERVDLPTLPEVFNKLLALVNDPDASIHEISNFVSKDPVLTSRILKLANSPLYGFPHKIHSVPHATVLLGANAVKGMLLGVSVFDALNRPMIGLWQHSLGVATAARIIAARTHTAEQFADPFAAGILHDLGKALIIVNFRVDYTNVLAATCDKSGPVAEQHCLGIDHATAGAYIARKWHFPVQLTEAMESHHAPALASESPRLTSTIHLADIMARKCRFGFSYDRYIPSFDPFARHTLGFSDQDLYELEADIAETLSRSIDLEF